MYFNNLNSVRFLAASLVVVHHVEQLKRLAGNPHHFDNPLILLIGKLGVVMFFALSGFLITSLLLAEKREAGRIHLRKFYGRRVLRIWPLYFVVVGLSLFVLPYVPFMHIPGSVNPSEQLGLNLFLLTFLLPNVQLLLVGPIAYSSQAWSIGVEEQFYLLWPLLVGWCTRPKALGLLTMLVLVAFLSVQATNYLLPKAFTVGWHMRGLSKFLFGTLPLNCMMWGGLFAILHITGAARYWLTKPYTQLTAYALFVSFALVGAPLGSLFGDVYAGLSAILFYNLVQPTSLLNLETRWLSWLGTLSYGMYMLHVLVAWPLIKWIGDSNLLLYPAVFAGTIGLSWVSYTYLENPFLKLKDRLTVLQKHEVV